ncbi:MAG: hypothetical protein BGO70_03725 [Bacteroidetes bacterium 43-93]|uniref:hypothetical protein n=1 Tax=uncultured Dysgonomonas sp. TaxID=206096 RepID=UPI000927AAAD|nr:hypothetical protein [uncultured Dysgonomonas sp.]MBN9485541.1 hypothetical protein [Bacteroidota bacterium]OJW99079.1 MAG: hypothetical protein BGO70_03725 [Bacteroidetes bacterium 43-93]
MRRIKIVQRYFTEAEAKKAAAFQRQSAKKRNLLVSKVEIIPAYSLFKQNGWFKQNPFKSIGLPGPEQFMVIVHYSIEQASGKQAINIKKRITKAVKENNVRKNFFIVTLNSYQLTCKNSGTGLTKRAILSWKYLKSNSPKGCIVLNCSLNARFVAA